MANIATTRKALSEHMTHERKSQSSVAKQLGVSKTTLSLFLKGSYVGDNEELASRIDQYLSMGTVKQSLAKPPSICLTLGNTERILETVHITHATSDILLLYGPAGCGKTTALKHYSSTHNGVIHVEADVTANSPRSILMLLMEAIGEDGRGSNSDIMRLLISMLKDTNRLIIIDEAQHLTPKSFDCIRTLNDKANIGIVYSGNPSILKRMYGRMADDFDQVHSRVGYHCCLQNLYSMADIAQLYCGFGIDKECLALMHKISGKKGGLRRMVKQCTLALNISLALNERLALYHFEEAAKRMGVGGLPV